ncbi:hypothetical protein BDSB_27965 [Burkholderia dolosa PC543]|nr:hypothetical protein BDSB_27965 [Burkholderia dolosa PC543]
MNFRVSFDSFDSPATLTGLLRRALPGERAVRSFRSSHRAASKVVVLGLAKEYRSSV